MQARTTTGRSHKLLTAVKVRFRCFEPWSERGDSVFDLYFEQTFMTNAVIDSPTVLPHKVISSYACYPFFHLPINASQPALLIC